MQVGQVLLHLPPETMSQPSCISIPRDCFEILGLPSDKTYQILNASAEKLYGCMLFLCQSIFGFVQFMVGQIETNAPMIFKNNIDHFIQ
jgi:hypothetical protein